MQTSVSSPLACLYALGCETTVLQDLRDSAASLSLIVEGAPGSAKGVEAPTNVLALVVHLQIALERDPMIANLLMSAPEGRVVVLTKIEEAALAVAKLGHVAIRYPAAVENFTRDLQAALSRFVDWPK